MSFSQALSGLNAQSENLKIIGNNIANSQTVGFKSSGAIFADVFAGANSQVGLGVKVANVRQDFTSGDLEATGRTLDLAVAGGGFYRVEQSSGEAAYTRNGQFSQDNQGFLVNAAGQRLTGYGLSDINDPFSEVIAGGAPQALRIPADDIAAKETGRSTATYNLDASVVAGENLQTAVLYNQFGTTDPANEVEVDYHFSNSFTVYDSLGNARNISTYYTKTGDNTWNVQVARDGVKLDNSNDFELTFDANGSLERDADNNIIGVGGGEEVNFTFPAGDLGGAEELDFTFNLVGTTQFNNTSIQNTLTQDGYSSGSLAGLEITRDGKVIRIFTNEQRREAGQVVLANFANEEGLQPIGDNAWRETNASGVGIIGTAGTGVFGTIESGVLENSNADLAKQLVDTIVSQRAYQANSTSISTQDELLQTIINL
ncbi:flagellar hook protein FlgE [Vreelandella venusta]|uniref:Flagellar hook protein FlgE n=1 Tax=Vreelandella venusta TaxID=44935 RepID=A0ABX2BCD8_9GAMM|nr:flagellar hook protein FlgE [Halomonas venusta]AZM94239.1 flagellar hook protein FlgE [Halomonas venusta]NPT31790.1 flagellar hook protein FlgE [Halomonas venusta]QPI64233.1 flagellar hook protein FlgE [Halomonas venusta]